MTIRYGRIAIQYYLNGNPLLSEYQLQDQNRSKSNPKSPQISKTILDKKSRKTLQNFPKRAVFGPK